MLTLAFLLFLGHALAAGLKLPIAISVAIEEPLCLEPILLIASDGASLLFPDVICEIANAMKGIQHADSPPFTGKEICLLADARDSRQARRFPASSSQCD